MKALYELKDLIDGEIRKVTAKGEITPAEIKPLGDLVDICKDIETIIAMKEYGQEDEQYSMENRGYSTRRMPRYPMYRDSYDDIPSTRRVSRDNYSRHTEKEEMIEKLEHMMNNATSEKERRDIMDCINKLES